MKTIELTFVGLEWEFEPLNAFAESEDTIAGMDGSDELEIYVDDEDIYALTAEDDEDFEVAIEVREPITHDLDLSIGAIRLLENETTYYCDLEIDEEFDPHKLVLNVNEYWFQIGGKTFKSGKLILHSITYDGIEYDLECSDSSENNDSEIVWGTDPDEVEDELFEKYDDVEQLSNNWFKVTNEDGLCTLCSPFGKRINNKWYDECGEEFDEEGVFQVCVDGNWGGINQEGKTIIKTKYDEPFCFESGRAMVKSSGEVFYIDLSGKRIIESTQTGDLPLDGMRVLATGKFQNYSREEIRTLIESKGATYASSVTESLDLLVCGDDVGQKKIDKATKLGIKMVDESEFMQMIAGSDLEQDHAEMVYWESEGNPLINNVQYQLFSDGTAMAECFDDEDIVEPVLVIPEKIKARNNKIYTVTHFIIENLSCVEELSLPKTIISLDGAFSDTCTYDSRQCKIKLNGNPNVIFEDNIFYNGDKTVILNAQIAAPEGDFVIPEGVTEVCNNAFNNAKSMESITFPSTIRMIGAAFDHCDSLKTVYIKAHKTDVAFYEEEDVEIFPSHPDIIWTQSL